MKTKYIILVFVLFFGTINFIAQNNSDKTDVYVDENGVMRWGESNKEVKGFGVNYTVPFAHAYRSAKRMGIDPKKAIDNDVYHLSNAINLFFHWFQYLNQRHQYRSLFSPL